MAVILANCDLTVNKRAHPFKRDARGYPVPTGGHGGNILEQWLAQADADEITIFGPSPGNATEQADETWVLRVDPASWPIRAGDQITDGTRVWIATGAPNLVAVPEFDDVDFVNVTATLEPPRVV
jgi:hypothetical protein